MKKLIIPSPKNTNIRTKHHKAKPAVLFFTILCLLPVTALASAGGDALSILNNLNEFVFNVIAGIGILVAAFGGIMFFLSFQSHDGAQKSNGLMALVGGILVFSLRAILAAIGVA